MDRRFELCNVCAKTVGHGTTLYWTICHCKHSDDNNFYHRQAEQTNDRKFALTFAARVDFSAVVSWTSFACRLDLSFLLAASSSRMSDNSAVADCQINTLYSRKTWCISLFKCLEMSTCKTMSSAGTLEEFLAQRLMQVSARMLQYSRV